MTSIAADAETWIRRYEKSPDSALRLVCLPYAGGSASYFFPVAKALAPSIEVLAIQYPGRQDRHREPCIDDIGKLADAVVGALEGLDDKPLALFGHSMGATLSYEVALRLEKRKVMPVRLFVSGRRAPSRVREESVHQRDDAGVLEELRMLNGTNGEVLENEELLRMALPAIRGDYRAIESYRCEPGRRISCPITALTGDADPRASVDEVRDWEKHTTAEMELTVLSGGHFFLNDHVPQVLKIISERLLPATRS
ncbi:alpha/beta fold hydrolase [Streptomyces sp. FXJ1.4098]|uniref:thioesterase II family protein n=1 Tax=Streptomyces sp. NPDC020845 TaxID=3365096 RepID=UPI00299A5669|nr:alpha/beta fold hydrolase [Streptomyces sp. FXJ1.4098]